MKLRILFIGIFLIFSFHITSQAQKVKGIKGMAILGPHATLEETELKALEDAKKNALTKVIGEKISSIDILQTDNERQDFFSYSTSQINGGIIDCIITGNEKDKDRFGNITVTITIDATIKKYQTYSDPTFTFLVKDIKTVYSNNEWLNCRFIANSPGYLKIFILENIQDAVIIYPNIYDKGGLVPAGDTIQIPQKSKLRFTKNSFRDRETNYIIFAFTKKEYPFKGEVTYHNVNRWLNAIEPNEKEIQYFPIEIRN